MEIVSSKEDAMPYATNPDDGVHVYYEIEGDGPPLVIHHGGGSNLDRWRERSNISNIWLASYSK